jgi:hypothetical protein
MVLTTITKVAALEQPALRFGDDYTKLRQLFWYKDCLSLASHCSDPYPTGEDLTEVCWQTMTCGLDSYGHAASPEHRTYESFCKRWSLCADYPAKVPVQEHDPGLAEEEVDQAWVFGVTVHERRLGFHKGLCLTTDGYLGMVSPKAKVGDQICVLLGGKVPLVLRLEDGKLTASFPRLMCMVSCKVKLSSSASRSRYHYPLIVDKLHARP